MATRDLSHEINTLLGEGVPNHRVVGQQGFAITEEPFLLFVELGLAHETDVEEIRTISHEISFWQGSLPFP